jgi:hypothetical protein
MSFRFWPYLSQILVEFLKSWTSLQVITISIHKYDIYKVLVIIVEIHMDYSYEKIYNKKPVRTSLFSVHGPIRTGPKGSGCGPPISWSVLDRFRLLVAPFGSQKPDWTGPLNTIQLLTPLAKFGTFEKPSTASNSPGVDGTTSLLKSSSSTWDLRVAMSTKQSSFDTRGVT